MGALRLGTLATLREIRAALNATGRGTLVTSVVDASNGGDVDRLLEAHAPNRPHGPIYRSVMLVGAADAPNEMWGSGSPMPPIVSTAWRRIA